MQRWVSKKRAIFKGTKNFEHIFAQCVTKFAHRVTNKRQTPQRWCRRGVIMKKQKETTALEFKNRKAERQYFNKRREMEKRIRHKPVGRREWEEI